LKKERLDTYLVAQGHYPSREKARAAIMAGLVLVDGVKIDKAGTPVQPQAGITLLGGGLKYVSRGGLKLEKAIACFQLDLAGKRVLDVGASTGGFTDCALQNGAVKVYAVDVGYGQLDWRLRQDPRVVVLERVNARYLTRTEIPEAVDLITIDVSFISLEKILPALMPLLAEEGCIAALIKPQFEAGRDQVGKKGVVRDPAAHREVTARILAAAAAMGLYCHGLTYSPVTGPEGNIEYLALFRRVPAPADMDPPGVVAEAFAHFRPAATRDSGDK